MILIKIDMMMMLLEAQEKVDFKGIRDVLELARDQRIEPSSRLAMCMSLLEDMGLQYMVARKEQDEDPPKQRGFDIDYQEEEIELELLNGRVKFWLGMN